jgi:hypothetical protein
MPIRLLISLILLYSHTALAQFLPGWKHSVESASIIASSANIPFFLRANQNGTIPLSGSFSSLRLATVKDYQTQTDTLPHQKKRLDWGVGIKGIATISAPSLYKIPTFLLPEAYLKIKWGKVELLAGKRQEVVGLGDTLLTSGFVVWSGNALPIPKIQIHTPDFVELGFTKKLLAFRAGYAHGWFANSYIRGSYLHQKYLYVRLGKPGWRVRVVAGLNHQVQWGGHADYLVGTPLAVNGHLPTSFQDYLSLITGRYPEALQNDRFTDFDGTNRIGNHIGSYDIAIEWRQSDQNWLLYHQHVYEDASGLALQNVPDGLTGLRFQKTKLSSAKFQLKRWVLEWLQTTNQSGDTFDQTARYQGADNYFNHSQYREGWTYQGRTIGTPFIAPYTELAPDVANLGGSFFPNNRLTAWYTALEAAFYKGPTIQTRLAYSRNLGTFSKPYPHPFDQFSASVAVRWAVLPVKGLAITVAGAVDQGTLLTRSAGSWISLQKTW